MLKIVNEFCVLVDEEYSVFRWKSYNSERRRDHAEIVADDLLLKVFQIAQVKKEHWSRGSSRLNSNDCIVDNMIAYSLVFVILMLKWWWLGTWFIMMRFWALVADKYLLCSHMDELDVGWFRDKNNSCISLLLWLRSFAYICYFMIMVIVDHMDVCLFEDVALIW